MHLLIAFATALTLDTGATEVKILAEGAMIESIVLKADSGRMNPLWAGSGSGGRGHFLCLDGFGGVSPEEQAAGLRSHGEAVGRTFEVLSSTSREIRMRTALPLVQENVTRTFRAEGPNVLRIDTEVESLLGFDRPMSWAEHATIGTPFLEPGKTVVDLSAARSQTRPHTRRKGTGLPQRYPSGVDFIWPNAPTQEGKTVDIRVAPDPPNSGGHTTSLIDVGRDWGWVTALHPDKRLLVGWVWKRSDFPWLQNWEYYTPGRMARGLEFSTQPYDVPRREAVNSSPMFGTPTFRWLPAKSRITTTFLMFYTAVPEGFSGVKDVALDGARLTVSSSTGAVVTLTADR
jgi:hypothetical protein